MKNKRLALSLAVFVGVLAIASVAILANFRHESAPSSAGTLNVLNWTSYIPSDVIADFEKEYGIKVNYGTYSSNEELLAKVSSSAEGTYDLVFPSDYMVELMTKRDMLAPLDLESFQNLGNLNPVFLNQPYDETNSYSLPFLLATSVIVYDESKLAPIISYKDLLQDGLKNNLVLIDDQRIIIGAMLNAVGYDMNTTDDSALSVSLDFFTRLKGNIKAFDSDSPKTFLITGEADAGLIWNAEALLAKSEREHLKIVYPAEGFALSMDNFCILKGAKNVANAELFIDYLLRDDVSQRIVDEYPYISPNQSAASLPDAELREIFANGSYVENVGADIKKFDRLWAKYK